MEFTCEFKLVDFGSLKALATVKFDGFEIRGFKIIDNGNGNGDGPWVGMPSREVVRDGRKDYFDIVRFSDDEAKKAFTVKVLEEYRKATEPAPAGKNGSAGRRRK